LDGRDHKSLVTWQVANGVVRGVLKACRLHWRPHAAALFDQLQRSSLSVQLTIAEGYARGGRRKFDYHLRIAYGSAVETDDLLELEASEHLLPVEEGRDLLTNCQRTQRLLLGMLHWYGRVVPPRTE
jgi:four helix bundle protein